MATMFATTPISGLELLAEYALQEWKGATSACDAAREAGDRDTEIDEGLRAKRANDALTTLAQEICFRQMEAQGMRVPVIPDEWYET
jgi:hypothetical protein